MTEQAKTLNEHWKAMLLRNADDFRYAVTLTMNQVAKHDGEGEHGHWTKLTPEIASAELRHFKNKLNAAVYGDKWHIRLQGRKPGGLYFIPVIQGKVEAGLGNFWKSGNEAPSISERIDEHGEIHSVKQGAARHRLQNLHYHCFIDRDLACCWDNNLKTMVEVRDKCEVTQLIKTLWNQVAYGARISQIDVQDIYAHPRKHEGWAEYITSEMYKDCEGYDYENVVIRNAP